MSPRKKESEETAVAVVAKKEESGIKLTDDFRLSPVLFDQAEREAFGEVMRENMGDSARQLPIDRVAWPTSGSKTFNLPSSEEDGEVAKALTGIVIDHHDARAYWETEEIQKGRQPDCFSNDGITGVGILGPGSQTNPSGQCRSCPMAEFGTDAKGGRAQACKQMHRLYMLLDGNDLPISLSIPPSSLAHWSKYIFALTRERRRLSTVVTRVGLAEAQNAGGVSYMQATLARVADVPKDHQGSLKGYIALLQPLLRRSADASALAEEYAGNVDPTDADAPDDDTPADDDLAF